MFRRGCRDVVDVAEMTYSEVLHRLVAIMYVDVATDSAVEAYGMAQGLTRDEVRHERWTPHGRWLDATYQTRVFDFLRRAEERCRGTRPGPSFKIDAEAKPAPTLVRSPDALATNPLALVTQVWRRESSVILGTNCGGTLCGIQGTDCSAHCTQKSPPCVSWCAFLGPQPRDCNRKTA